MRYLVALDGWDPSEHALAFAVEQAAASGASIDVVHVVDEGGGDPGARDQIRATVERILDDADVEYELHFPETDKTTKPANKVGDRLLSFVEERDHDAVFVGNEPTGTAQRLIVGSVARTLIQDRSVPVVLVP